MGCTAAFVLRPLDARDAPQIAALLGDWEVVRWLAMPPHPYAVRDANEFIANAKAAAIADGCRTEAIAISGALAGIISIDLRSVGHNLGFWLGRSFWGHGIMTAAATEMTRDFFASSREDVLTSGFFSGNEASCAVQQRLGFQVTGEGSLFNRPHGKHLPHVDTALTRARFDSGGMLSARTSVT